MPDHPSESYTDAVRLAYADLLVKVGKYGNGRAQEARREVGREYVNRLRQDVIVAIEALVDAVKS
jgi:hypothetical protein